MSIAVTPSFIELSPMQRKALGEKPECMICMGELDQKIYAHVFKEEFDETGKYKAFGAHIAHENCIRSRYQYSTYDQGVKHFTCPQCLIKMNVQDDKMNWRDIPVESKDNASSGPPVEVNRDEVAILTALGDVWSLQNMLNAYKQCSQEDLLKFKPYLINNINMIDNYINAFPYVQLNLRQMREFQQAEEQLPLLRQEYVALKEHADAFISIESKAIGTTVAIPATLTGVLINGTVPFVIGTSNILSSTFSKTIATTTVISSILIDSVLKRNIPQKRPIVDFITRMGASILLTKALATLNPLTAILSSPEEQKNLLKFQSNYMFAIGCGIVADLGFGKQWQRLPKVSCLSDFLTKLPGIGSCLKRISHITPSTFITLGGIALNLGTAAIGVALLQMQN